MRFIILACLVLLSACGRDGQGTYNPQTSSLGLNQCSKVNGQELCTRIGR